MPGPGHFFNIETRIILRTDGHNAPGKLGKWELVVSNLYMKTATMDVNEYIAENIDIL